MNVSMPGVEISSGDFSTLVSEITVTPGTHEQIVVRAPATGKPITQLPLCRAADIEYAAGRARRAQADWAARPVRDRTRILLRFHDLLLDRQNEVLDLIQLETGKARRHAFEEVLDTAIVARYYGFRAPRLLRPRRRKGALPVFTRTLEIRCPAGVVGFIIPWNFPLTLAITDAIPALLAGNAAVLKPDPQTSLTALWAARLLRECGVPRDLIQVVTGDGPGTGAPLIDHVDYIMFTGSGRAGRLVAQQAAGRLIGCSLELGGKNPMIVLADADLEAAADGAVRGCYPGAGQTCISIERIYVEAPAYDRFVEEFAKRTRSLRLGAAGDYSIDVGSLTSERQLRTVEDHVHDAVAKGATVLAGGRARPDLGPFFYEPTILSNVTGQMKLFAEETFGPVVSVYCVADEAEAIRRANDTPYGLSASVWTRSQARGVRIAKQIRAGSVNVNEAYAAAWGSVDSPIGGMKESGLHPRHGAEGLLKFTESQTIAIERLLPIGPAFGMSPGFYARLMTLLLRVLRFTRVLG